MNNTNNALETLVQRDKQIKKANDKLKASINELDAELETTTNALSNHANDTNIHTSKEELIQLIVDHLESLDLGITKEVVSVLPTENISDNTLYFVPNEKGYHNEYLYINDKWELVGSTETNFTDYYTKLETNTLLEGKANSVHNHVVKDITDFPTIPTKVSDLTNDSGYITGVAWGDITSKPIFSDIAISGSYNDLVDTPTIPTKTSELANDSGYITSVSWEDVTSKPELSQVAISGSYSDLSGTPTIPTKTSQLINDSGFLTSSSGVITSVSWSDITNKPNFSTVATSGSYTDLSNTPTIPTKVSQLENDTGFINALTDVVDTKSNQTINGNKTFTKNVHCYSLKHLTDNDYFYISGGSDWNKGANLFLYGISLTDGYAGAFELVARNATETRLLKGYPNGTLTWGGKNVALDENLVHKSGDETINGTKKFTSDIDRKYTAVDITKTPTSDMYAHFNFTDKNDKTVAYIQYAQESNGVDYIGLRVRDKNSNTWGVQLNTNKEFVPFGNNSYSLGSSSYKWTDAYIDRVICTRFTHSVNNGSVYIAGGSEWDKGANLVLHGEESSDAGTFIINSRDKTRTLYLVGRPDGTLQWAGQDIATTAWVRTYVESVSGNNTVGSSVSAYWSNSSNVTATGQSSSGGYYPECYSEYVSKTPVVGTIYSGAQLYTVLNTYASATGSLNNSIYVTNNKAQATLSNSLSSTAKYLCTTANTFSFRAHTAIGNSSSVGTSSVVNATLTQSIFIRVQ